MTMLNNTPPGISAIYHEMERQHADALASYENNRALAAQVAASLRSTKQLLLLGMGASHAVGRAVEPLYRSAGIDAIAIPLSEQLGAPVRLSDKTVFLTSQSGESGEVLRWFTENAAIDRRHIFGLTLEASSFLAKQVPSLVGVGGTEKAFAATRSLTICLALHLAVLTELGVEPTEALNVLRAPEAQSVDDAIAMMGDVQTIVTSGRLLQGVAEALALGLTELARLPCYSLEGGQLRHGPMEMLGPQIGLVLFRADDHTVNLVKSMAHSAIEAGSPVIVFDSSTQCAVEGAHTIRFKPASGLAAVFKMLPVAQSFMTGFAATRVSNAGEPIRSNKITRVE